MDDEFGIFIGYSTTVSFVRMLHGQLKPTTITITADVSADTDFTDTEINNIFHKINFFLENIFSNSIVFSHTNTSARELFLTESGLAVTNNSIMITPNEPTDEVMSVVLKAKLNALGEEALSFDTLNVESNEGFGLNFTFVGDQEKVLPDLEEWMGDHYYYTEAWWNRNDGSMLDIVQLPDEDISVPPVWEVTLTIQAEEVEDIEQKSKSKINVLFNPLKLDGKPRTK
ncbi:MAG: hypothetical protein EOO61_15375 [Hymenobacter sp.]|nr:MAG: hypothetical protein EOO61_15375 [Hymenobacter sp.]